MDLQKLNLIKDKITHEKTFKKIKNIHPKEKHIVLKNYNIIDPFNIEEYIAKDGYFSLYKSLNISPENIIEEITLSNLRGRGGVGFPTGLKWKYTRNNIEKIKYIVCNADEGEPGTYMDKHILEGDPHSVIEGMIIAGYAINAKKGYIYLRAEYPKAYKTLKHAINQCYEYNILGKNILNSGFDFDIDLRVGAGAFICGEESSLLESIEGNRGESRIKPPYPASKGLFNKPTAINNVETLACIPHIILNGSEWFKSIGTEKSSGTKVFSISGNINNPGIFEVPFGITLREIIYDLGKGMPKGSKFNYASFGGPSGGFLFEEHIDIPIDFDSLQPFGAIMGSGGIVIFDQTNCIIDILKLFMKFNREESCGKCTPCRQGTYALENLLQKFINGTAKIEDLNKIVKLGNVMKKTALCGLGQAAPLPIFSALRYRKEIFIQHINNQCPICQNGGEING